MSALWIEWMAAMSWQAGLLICLVLAAETVLRHRLWPQLRYGLWLLVALKLVIPPTIESPVGLAPPPPSQLAAVPETPLPSLLFVWAAGAALAAAVALFRAHALRRRLLRGGEPFPSDELERAARRMGVAAPRTVLTSGIASPAVFGLRRPTVVLPRELMSTMTARQREHVLLHEFAHIKRRDLWVQALFGALNVAYWFHPLVWLARRRAYAARELCCDATVAAVLQDETPQYRATLARAALLVAGPAGFAGHRFGPSAILARLHALESWRHPLHRRLATAAVWLALLVFAVPMARAITAQLTPLERERDEARAALQHGLDNYEEMGCMQLRFMWLRAQALEEQAAARK